jgi:hypothetical protein
MSLVKKLGFGQLLPRKIWRNEIVDIFKGYRRWRSCASWPGPCEQTSGDPVGMREPCREEHRLCKIYKIAATGEASTSALSSWNLPLTTSPQLALSTFRVVNHIIDSSPFFPHCSCSSRIARSLVRALSRILSHIRTPHLLIGCGEVDTAQGSSVRHCASRTENHALRSSVRYAFLRFHKLQTRC